MTNSNIQNLNSHYSSHSKVELPKKQVANAPAALPSYHLFNDIDANNKMLAINNDIYAKSEKERSKPFKTFCVIFGSIVAAILAFKGIKSILK